jgi:hypothetical protein
VPGSAARASLPEGCVWDRIGRCCVGRGSGRHGTLCLRHGHSHGIMYGCWNKQYMYACILVGMCVCMSVFAGIVHMTQKHSTHKVWDCCTQSRRPLSTCTPGGSDRSLSCKSMRVRLRDHHVTAQTCTYRLTCATARTRAGQAAQLQKRNRVPLR